VIDHGRIVHDGNLDQLRAQLATERTMTVDFDDVPAIAAFSGTSGMRMVEQTGPRLRVAFERSRLSAPEVLAALSVFGSVRDMAIEEPTIEPIIQHLHQYGGAAAPVIEAE
jgi:ABC-2 type transport system ATP-binding protein